MIRLERVVDVLPAGVDALREEARGQGHRMLDTLATEWASGVQHFVHPDEALFAAYIGDELAGFGGITMEPSIPGAMRMRRFYTALAYRRIGVGRALVAALLEHAQGRVITVNAAVGSETFWGSFGFVPDRHGGHTHIRC
jgi:GNAT superfamily N-acetyltransferase